MNSWTKLESIREAAVRGQLYLGGLQQEDGGFPVHDAHSEAWGTAQCALALALPDASLRSQRAVAWLRVHVRADGGWSSAAYSNVTSGDSDVAATAYALRALACCGKPDDRALIERARDWLVEVQRSDGSWGIFRADDERGYVGQTGYAISALAHAPSEHRAAEAIQSALYFLNESARPSGGWALAPGHRVDQTLTAYAIRGLIDVAVLRGQPPNVKMLTTWLQNSEQAQNPDGSWGDWYGNASSVEATAYTVELAASMGELSGSSLERVPAWLARSLRFLATSQCDGGGWPLALGREPSHWVTHSVVVALYAVLGQGGRISLGFDIADSRGELVTVAETGYDFAISFAGAERSLAKALAILLTLKGAVVFYDEFEAADLWGANLVERLTDVYLNRARLCIMIISPDYVSRAWPRLERRSALARAFAENDDYILPLRVGGNIDVPGLLHVIGYLDVEAYEVEDIAVMAMEKLRRLGPR